jgi:hypothetical protein
LDLRNHGARMVYAAVLPHTSFGFALYSPSKWELQVTQGMLGGAGLKKPLGASQVLAQAVDSLRRSAKFVSIKEAVGRWAREVWRLASRSRPLDALMAREATSVAQAAQQARDGESDMVNGPLAALVDTLRELGWCIKAGGNAFEIKETGYTMHVSSTSPREVARVGRERWQGKLPKEDMHRLKGGRSGMGDLSEHERCH